MGDKESFTKLVEDSLNKQLAGRGYPHTGSTICAPFYTNKNNGSIESISHTVDRFLTPTAIQISWAQANVFPLFPVLLPEDHGSQVRGERMASYGMDPLWQEC